MKEYEIITPESRDSASLVMLYGIHGVGKNTLAAGLDLPIFVQTREAGMKGIDAPSLPQTEDLRDLHEQLRWVYGQCAKGAFSNVVIDGASSIEEMIIEDIFATEKAAGGEQAQGLEDYGWNRGYEMVLSRWNKIISMCKKIKDGCGVNVVILAHSQISKNKNPTGVEYGRYFPALVHREGCSSRDMILNNCDAVLFYRTDLLTATKGKGKMSKTVAGSDSIEPDRVVYTEERSAFVAKNRHDLEPSYIIKKDSSFMSDVFGRKGV